MTDGGLLEPCVCEHARVYHADQRSGLLGRRLDLMAGPCLVDDFPPCYCQRFRSRAAVGQPEPAGLVVLETAWVLVLAVVVLVGLPFAILASYLGLLDD